MYKFCMTQHTKVSHIALVFLIKEGRLYLGQRCHTGDMDGYWSIAGGHIEAGETPVQAAVREIQEEMAVRICIKDLNFVGQFSRHNPDGNRDSVDYFFVCSCWQGDVQNAEPDKCGGWRLFALDDLPCPMIDTQLLALRSLK